MVSLERSTFPHVFSLLVLLTFAAKPVCADDLTGMPHDDPKDLLPAPAQQAASSPTSDNGFLPLPSWARGAVMPPLPQALKPMGKKVAVLTTPPVAAPQPLAPPKDSTPATVIVAKPTPVAPAPPAQTPALIAVSPFLEWIKANPQTAAEQARQQASTYTAGSDANAAAPTTNANAAPNTTGNPPGAGAPAAPPPPPYWLPPLIDTAPFGPGEHGKLRGDLQHASALTPIFYAPLVDPRGRHPGQSPLARRGQDGRGPAGSAAGNSGFGRQRNLAPGQGRFLFRAGFHGCVDRENPHRRRNAGQ